ncbi:MAG: GNAT family N-acetyltransferase [bacterium]
MSSREVKFQDLDLNPKFDAIEFSKAQAGQWDDFVWNADNGTIFHTRRFLSYHPPGRIRDNSLIIIKDREWIALFPAAVKRTSGAKILVSHLGASFGGAVIKSPQSIKDTFQLLDVIVNYAHQHAFSKIIMTLPPQIYFSRPNNYFDFALQEFGFTFLKREVSSMLPLDFAEEDILFKFTASARRAVRKAINLGVVVRESNELDRFYVLLERNLKLRHNVQPTHSLAEIESLKKLFPERIRLFAAYKDSSMIAGILIFICNEKVALAFYISHDEKMQENRGVNVLFYEVIRWSLRRRLQFLDFGIFTVNMKPNWGLARFKESFGALGVFRDTVAKDLT